MRKVCAYFLCITLCFILFPKQSAAEEPDSIHGKLFDSTDQISITNLPVNTSSGAKNTVEFWMYWDGTNGQMPFSWSSGYDLYLAGGYFGFNTFESNVIGVSSSGLKGKWVHVAAIFYNGIPNSSDNELYINGVKQNISQVINTTSRSKTVSSSAYISGFGDQYKFNGRMARLRIWDRPLTAQEIQYSIQKTILNGNEEGLIGTWDLAETPQNSKSFDGINQIKLANLSVNSSSGGKNTVQFWMYWDGTMAVMPFSWQGTYDLYFVGNSFGFNTGQGNILGISAEKLKNTWVNVAAVFYNGVPSSSDNELYINGVKQSLSPIVGTTTASKTVSSQAFISGLNEKYKFKGKLADLQIWNRALSETEIQSNMYKSYFASNEKGLVGSWNLIDEPPVYKTFEGSSQIALNGLPVSTSLGSKNTVEFWMYWDGTNNQMPFSWSSGYDLYLTGGYFGFNTFESNLIGVSSSGLKGKWVHVAAIFYNGVPNSNDNELYINGVKQNITQVINTTSRSKTASSSAYISGFGDNYKFKGKIAIVRVWNKALPAEEIQSHMYETLSVGQATNLIGVWHLSDDLSPVEVPISESIQYFYDAAGRLNYIKLPSGQTYEYEYDANGNLIEKQASD